MAINQNPFLEALKRGNFGQGPAPEVPQVTPSIQVPQMIGTGAAPIFDKAQTVGEFLQSPFATGVEAAAGQAQSGQPLPAGTTIRTPEQDIAAARGLPDPSAGITTTSLGPNFQQTGVGQVGSPVPQVPVAPAAVGQGTVMQAPSQAFESAGIPQQQFDPQSIPTPQAPAAGPTFGGQPLSEFLAGGTQLDPQGRMIDPSVDRSEYEEQVLGREQRLESMLADRESARQAQRGGEDGGITDSQFRALSGGNQDVERQLRAQAELGMGPFKERDQGLTFEQKLAQDKFDFDVAKFKFDEASKAEDAATVERKSQDSAKFAARDMLRQNQNVMRKAQRAGKNIGFSTTGATGALLGIIPGTGAFDQKSTVETLQADAAFSTLQQMRNASKTGGALGQVSERELDLLMGAVGNLKIGQSEEQFRNNLVEYINLRNDAMGNIYDAFEADYGTQAANEAFKVNSRQDLVPEGGTSTGGTGTQTDATSGRFLVEVASD